MWLCCDLHVHSDRSSDCRVAAADVVQAAASRGVRLLAVTDHHDLGAFQQARDAGRRRGVIVLPGVELCCPTGRSGVHILGVFNPRLDRARATAELELDVPGLGNAAGSVPYDVVDGVRRIHALDGLAIAAHARGSKGLLEECRGQTLAWVLENADFDAIELGELREPFSNVIVPVPLRNTALICGSDAHEADDFVSDSHRYGVGGRPFWADAPSATFNGLRAAFRNRSVEPFPSFSNTVGRQRVDHLLRLNQHFLRVATDDAPTRRAGIIGSAVELLNDDGGYLLVGVRRRFQGATRGAQLQLTMGQLHDLVVESITPSPVIHMRRHRASNGSIYELAFRPAENPCNRYDRRPRAAAARAARADRAALQALGALDVKRMSTELLRRARADVLGIGELVRLWPYRDWFDGDRELADLVGLSLATLVIERDRMPRWLRLWAAEAERARHHYRMLYRTLARRDATRDHRERLREALSESVQSGRLQASTRRSTEQWFERVQAELLTGEPAITPPATGIQQLRERAKKIFGEAIAGELDTEAQRAEAQYRAAMQEAFGAQATVVLETHARDDADGDDVMTLGDLAKLGIDRVIAGAGAAANRGSVVVVPDRLATLGVNNLLELWAQPDLPNDDVIPGIVRRCIECGKHLPVLRFAALSDRQGVEQLVNDLGDVGATQARNSILRDLRQLLDPPGPSWQELDYQAVFAALNDELDVEQLKEAAEAALDAPDVARQALNQRPQLAADIRRAAEPGTSVPLRRPATVLAGALGDRGIVDFWDDETNWQVRLSLVEGISLLGADEEVDRVLYEALASNAGLVQRAARALATRGDAGYGELVVRLPEGAQERMYLINGVVTVSYELPDRARTLAFRACYDASGPALHAARSLDKWLYLDEAQRQNQMATESASRQERPRAARAIARDGAEPGTQTGRRGLGN